MTIDPWGRRAADLPVLGRPLGEWRAEALRPAGLPGHLSAADDLWVSPALARAFGRAAAATGAPASLALRAGLQTDFAGALQDLRREGDLWIYPLSWRPSPGDEAPGSAPP